MNINFVDTEYSDERADEIDEWFSGVSKDFAASSQYKQLTKSQKKHGLFMISCFYDLCYSYCLTGPGEVDEGVIDEICLLMMPRKISEGKAAYEAFAPSIEQFWLWCEAEGHMQSTKDNRYHVHEVAPLMIENSQDPECWGMAKSMLIG